VHLCAESLSKFCRDFDESQPAASGYCASREIVNFLGTSEKQAKFALQNSRGMVTTAQQLDLAQ